MLQTADVLAGRRMLVAEDDSLIALNLEMMLQGFGCEVVGPVAEVEAIVAVAGTESLDGALLDVDLRGRKVFEALPALVSRGVPIVLTSGYSDTTLFPDEWRALPCIAKPFEERALRRACIEMIGTVPA